MYFRPAAAMAAAIAISTLTGCTNTMTWQEEVRLLDGRTIVVTQKRRYEKAYTGHDFGMIPREAWVTLQLPELGSGEIVWHERLTPQVLNTYQGRLYIVARPPTEREFRDYGRPKPAYLAYVYREGRWDRIPFSEIPLAIYATNMVIEAVRPGERKRVSLAAKSLELAEPTLSGSLKRLDPQWSID